MSWQLSYHDMYKIVTCWDNYFSSKSNFFKIWIMQFKPFVKWVGDHLLTYSAWINSTTGMEQYVLMRQILQLSL